MVSFSPDLSERNKGPLIFCEEKCPRNNDDGGKLQSWFTAHLRAPRVYNITKSVSEKKPSG